jgi:hypothetical protein
LSSSPAWLSSSGDFEIGSNNIVPISDTQAKAIEEALKTLQGLGGFLRETFGTVPQDLVGLLGGDWLKVRRAENLVRVLQRTKERLTARHVRTGEPASLSLGLPILVAAADESREELQDIWARLLAASADPSRASHFRIAFIDAAKRMDPLDAPFLLSLRMHSGRADGTVLNSIGSELKITRDEIDVSWNNLKKLELLTLDSHTAVISSFGREFLRAPSD